MRLAVGRAFATEMSIAKPLNNVEIMACINAYGGDDPRGRLLIQEIVLLLAMLVKIDPQVFKDTSTLQCWHLLLLLTGELAWEKGITQDEAFNEVLELNPQRIMQYLHQLLTSAEKSVSRLASVESLHIGFKHSGFVTVDFTEDYNPPLHKPELGWTGWRSLRGAVTKLPKQFFQEIWQDLEQCAGVVIGDRLDAHNRLNSQIIRADMTAGEQNFVRLIKDKLNHIQAPEYRQLAIEALQVLSRIRRSNPALRLQSYVVLDVFIGHAVRINWETSHAIDNQSYSEHSANAWQLFYSAPPHQVANSMVVAFEYLLEEIGQAEAMAN